MQDSCPAYHIALYVPAAPGSLAVLPLRLTGNKIQPGCRTPGQRIDRPCKAVRNQHRGFYAVFPIRTFIHPARAAAGKRRSVLRRTDHDLIGRIRYKADRHDIVHRFVFRSHPSPAAGKHYEHHNHKHPSHRHPSIQQNAASSAALTTIWTILLLYESLQHRKASHPAHRSVADILRIGCAFR